MDFNESGLVRVISKIILWNDFSLRVITVMLEHGAGQAQVDFSSTLIGEGVKGTKVKGR